MLCKYIETVSGKDYAVIDTCTDLEDGLPGEVLKHCILSISDPSEYSDLVSRFGSKCLRVVNQPVAPLEYEIIPTEFNSAWEEN